MMFQDRYQAGEMLASRLEKFRNDKKAVVLGLPRGGVVTAYAVAKELHLALDVICIRKLGAPYNPELAIGAVDSSGEGYYNDDIITALRVPEDYIKQIVEKEKNIALQRLKMYRQNRTAIDLHEKKVVLVDDGLATGATMKAAVRAVRAAGADYIVVAVPVSPPSTLDELKEMADEVTCLSAPSYFAAVGQFYEDFSQTEDDEVIKFLGMQK